MENKLTDNEIIKALECCSRGVTIDACNICPFGEIDMCLEDRLAIKKLALDLINRQKAEIERLKTLNSKFEAEIVFLKQDNMTPLTTKICDIAGRIENAKAEAIKEFAERLCEDRVANDPVVIAVKCELKEMVDNNDL